MKRLGIALGGGAARGLAHLGVLKVLEREQIPVDILVGSSIGSVVAAMYAFNPDIEVISEQVRTYFKSPLFEMLKFNSVRHSVNERRSFYEGIKKKMGQGWMFASSLRNPGVVNEAALRENLKALLPDASIETSQINLALNAFDLKTGKEYVLQTGPVLDAVMASCAIPGFFPPIGVRGRPMMDGSWINPVPCNIARKLGAECVVGVDITIALESSLELETGYDIALRAGEISRHHLKNKALAHADLVISVDVMDIHWADFFQVDTCIQRGIEAAEEKVDAIKEHLYTPAWKRWIQGWTPQKT